MRYLILIAVLQLASCGRPEHTHVKSDDAVAVPMHKRIDAARKFFSERLSGSSSPVHLEGNYYLCMYPDLSGRMLLCEKSGRYYMPIREQGAKVVRWTKEKNTYRIDYSTLAYDEEDMAYHIQKEFGNMRSKPGEKKMAALRKSTEGLLYENIQELLNFLSLFEVTVSHNTMLPDGSVKTYSDRLRKHVLEKRNTLFREIVHARSIHHIENKYDLAKSICDSYAGSPVHYSAIMDHNMEEVATRVLLKRVYYRLPNKERTQYVDILYTCSVLGQTRM